MSLENIRGHLGTLRGAELRREIGGVPAGQLIEAWGDLEPDEQLKIFSLLDQDRKLHLLNNLPYSRQEQLVRSLSGRSARELLAAMHPDDLTDFIQAVSPEVREAAWNALSPEAREEARFLLKYDYDDAAGLMTTRFLAVRPNQKVAQALRWVRRNLGKVETVYSIYVVDPLQRLMGVVSLRDLLAAEDEALVREVMVAQVISVFPDTDQEQTAKILETHGLMALPVVDRGNRLLGIVTFDDVLDVIREEQSEDVYKMSAVSASRETYLESSVLALVRRRIPWLAVLLLAATLTSNVIAAYSSVLQAAVVLAFFIPIVTGTGGNSGTQSATLMIRGLATGELRFQDIGRVLLKEAAVGLLLGASLAVLTLGRAMLLPPRIPLHEALAVGAAMFSVIVVATLVGALAPMLITRLRLDPAVMAGPLMATLIDVSGLTIYFQTARLLLRLG